MSSARAGIIFPGPESACVRPVNDFSGPALAWSRSAVSRRRSAAVWPWAGISFLCAVHAIIGTDYPVAGSLDLFDGRAMRCLRPVILCRRPANIVPRSGSIDRRRADCCVGAAFTNGGVECVEPTAVMRDRSVEEIERPSPFNDLPSVSFERQSVLANRPDGSSIAVTESAFVVFGSPFRRAACREPFAATIPCRARRRRRRAGCANVPSGRSGSGLPLSAWPPAISGGPARTSGYRSCSSVRRSR